MSGGLTVNAVHLPDGPVDLAPGAVVIDYEHGDTPEDVIAAVQDGPARTRSSARIRPR